VTFPLEPITPFFMEAFNVEYAPARLGKTIFQCGFRRYRGLGSPFLPETPGCLSEMAVPFGDRNTRQSDSNTFGSFGGGRISESALIGGASRGSFDHPFGNTHHNHLRTITSQPEVENWFQQDSSSGVLFSVENRLRNATLAVVIGRVHALEGGGTKSGWKAANRGVGQDLDASV
jgi:hypothetical protein